VARAIHGPCQHCLMGKMVAPSYPPSLSTPASRPAELLHADIVSLAVSLSKRVPHLVMVDDFSDFVMVKKLTSKSEADVSSALEAMMHRWTSWGHRPYTLRTGTGPSPRHVVKQYDQDRRTPLHFACLQGHVEVSSLLLKAGANLEAAGLVSTSSDLICSMRKSLIFFQWSRTPLHY
jgi:hypothetical protein